MVSAGWALADIKETERYVSAEKHAKNARSWHMAR